jgi:hypothetical protein
MRRARSDNDSFMHRETCSCCLHDPETRDRAFRNVNEWWNRLGLVSDRVSVAAENHSSESGIRIGTVQAGAASAPATRAACGAGGSCAQAGRARARGVCFRHGASPRFTRNSRSACRPRHSEDSESESKNARCDCAARRPIRAPRHGRVVGTRRGSPGGPAAPPGRPAIHVKMAMKPWQRCRPRRTPARRPRQAGRSGPA